jgi:glycosyltransferase involved in cell wall biosynthesis
MTVLMAVPLYPPPVVGGLEKQAHELAIELIARNHRVLAVSGCHAESSFIAENIDGVEVYRIGGTTKGQWRWLARPLETWKWVRRLVTEADVIHVHVFSGFGLFFIVLARLHNKPVLVKLPNIGDDGLPGMARLRLGQLRLWLFRHADAVVAMAPQSHRELEAIGFSSARVLSTPNGIRMTPKPASPDRPADDRCRLVLVGRLHEQKGIMDLLEALKILPDHTAAVPWQLSIIGDGPLRDLIRHRTTAMGLLDRVHLLGHIEDVSNTLANSDVFVLPSYREGNSNAILEAMRAGLPVVSTNVGGTPMLVGATGFSLLHEPGDIQGLADRLTHVITQPAWRRELGAAMRHRVESHFDIKMVVSTYERAYETLIEQRREDVFRASNPVVLEGSVS